MDIASVRGTRLEAAVESAQSSTSAGPVKFDVSARLEEKSRRTGQITVFFTLTVGTKPSLVKFELEGYATLTGKDDAIVKMLEVDPKTGVPRVFHRVYQHSFMAIYLLATLMDTVYPPPDLLYSGERHAGQSSTEAKQEGEAKAEPGASVPAQVQQVATGAKT